MRPLSIHQQTRWVQGIQKKEGGREKECKPGIEHEEKACQDLHPG